MVLGAVVLVVAIVALREPGGHVTNAANSKTITRTIGSSAGSTTSKPKPSPTDHPTSSQHSSGSTNAGSDGDPKSVPIVVLNNTTTSGLAKDAAQRFEAGGWTVSKYDNYSNNILSTCAYYDPNDPQAKAAADALQQQYPAIQRVQPKFDGLDYGPVVVILTPDYSP